MLHDLRAWCARIFAAGFIVWNIAQGWQAPMRPPSPINYSAVYKPAMKKPKMRIAVRKPTDSVLCLAQNIYFEAYREPMEGIEAVAATVFNRMTSGLYPATICAVVYQPFQYSWTLDTMNWMRKPPAEYVDLAKSFLADRTDIQERYPVTHFHRADIKPNWSSNLVFIAQYGQHKFYENSRF